MEVANQPSRDLLGVVQKMSCSSVHCKNTDVVLLFGLIVLGLPDPTVAHDALALFVGFAVILCSEIQVFLDTLSMVVTMTEIILCIRIAQISCNLKELHCRFLVLLALLHRLAHAQCQYIATRNLLPNHV